MLELQLARSERRSSGALLRARQGTIKQLKGAAQTAPCRMQYLRQQGGGEGRPLLRACASCWRAIQPPLSSVHLHQGCSLLQANGQQGPQKGRGLHGSQSGGRTPAQ